MELKERYIEMTRCGIEVDENHIVTKGNYLWTDNILMCQAVALFSYPFIGLNHFLEYDKDELNEFLEEIRSKTKRPVKYAILSGDKKEHNKLAEALDKERCVKIAEFSDDFSYDQVRDYRKGLAIGPREAIVHLKPDSKKCILPEMYIKLV